MRERLLGSIDATAALDDLRWRQINYDPSRAPLDGRADGHWHVDSSDAVIGREPPGSPLPGGVWESACLLVLRYEFTDPKILRAVYRRDDELLGRDMLLEGRFFGLRFYLGVRVTRVIDETRDSGAEAERVWGWSYQTLEGHLEQGRLNYEVIKNLTSGQVVFRVSGYSRRAPVPDPVIRWGFRLFGRWTQQRFYRAIQARLRHLVQATQRGEPPAVPTIRTDGVAIAPSGATSHPLERFARGSHHPGS
ncbi:MAG TPA: DUF1990 family protein [Pseudonocardiaceae bacterium]|nr:DUF1990 family protein [Pseudonocardiaceae bacterium]